VIRITTNLILIISSLLVFVGCCYDKGQYRKGMEDMASVYCEDATLIGFATAYLGDAKWKELIDAYNEATEKSPYGTGCKKWNPHFKGRKIAEEVKTSD